MLYFCGVKIKVINLKIKKMSTIEEAATHAYCIETLSSGCNSGAEFGKEMFKEGVFFAQKWTSIKDGVPPAGETLLFKVEGYDCVVGFFTTKQGFVAKLFLPLGIENVEIKNVTHWRPIERV